MTHEANNTKKWLMTMTSIIAIAPFLCLSSFTNALTTSNPKPTATSPSQSTNLNANQASTTSIPAGVNPDSIRSEFNIMNQLAIFAQTNLQLNYAQTKGFTNPDGQYTFALKTAARNEQNATIATISSFVAYANSQGANTDEATVITSLINQMGLNQNPPSPPINFDQKQTTIDLNNPSVKKVISFSRFFGLSDKDVVKWLENDLKTNGFSGLDGLFNRMAVDFSLNATSNSAGTNLVFDALKTTFNTISRPANTQTQAINTPTESPPPVASPANVTVTKQYDIMTQLAMVGQTALFLTQDQITRYLNPSGSYTRSLNYAEKSGLNVTITAIRTFMTFTGASPEVVVTNLVNQMGINQYPPQPSIDTRDITQDFNPDDLDDIFLQTLINAGRFLGFSDARVLDFWVLRGKDISSTGNIIRAMNLLLRFQNISMPNDTQGQALLQSIKEVFGTSYFALINSRPVATTDPLQPITVNAITPLQLIITYTNSDLGGSYQATTTQSTPNSTDTSTSPTKFGTLFPTLFKSRPSTRTTSTTTSSQSQDEIQLIDEDTGNIEGSPNSGIPAFETNTPRDQGKLNEISRAPPVIKPPKDP